MTARKSLGGKLIPTPQEIRLISDHEELQGLLDEITVAASHLETKLEFPEDDDPERERGLRNRLSFCRSAIKAIEKQQKLLRAGGARPDAATIAKSRESRVLAAAEQSKAAVIMAQLRLEKTRENQRLQETQIKAKMLKSVSTMLKSVSWHVCFVRAARGTLSPDLLAKIEEAADADYLERVHQEAEPHIKSDK